MEKITLKIQGMMCGMCESHLNDAVRRIFPVKKVTSSHTKGEMVILAPEAIPEEAMKKVIAETGYDMTAYVREPYERKGLFGFRK